MNVAELGVNLGGAYSREREKGAEKSTETATKVEDTVEDKLVVPPGYKMTATIKTYQVKYRGRTDITVKAPGNIRIQIQYKTRRACGLCKRNHFGFVTIEELFLLQPSFHKGGDEMDDDPNLVQYKMAFLYTYDGAENEVVKEEVMI